MLAQLCPAKTPPKSLKHFNNIKKIVQTYRKAGENLGDMDVRKAIYKEINEYYSEPKDKLNINLPKELNDKAKKLIEKKFPESAKELRKKAKKLADEKYKICKLMEHVRVRYRRGDKTYSKEGIFYGFGGNSIKIDERTVAIYDLLPEFRYKFDKEDCKRQKLQFIRKMLSDFYTNKTHYSIQVRNEMKEKEIATNEDSGFIYAYDSWRTPSEVSKLYLNSISTLCKPTKKKKVEVASLKKEPDNPKKIVSNSPKKTEIKKEETTYEKIKKKAEEQLLKIANTCAGIDADQGYKMALWGQSKRDVKLLISEGKDDAEYNNDKNTGETTSKAEDFFTITLPNDNPIEVVELHFIHGIFYKVVVNFRIVENPAAMQRIGTVLNDRYGMTDELKKLRATRKKADDEADEEADEAEQVKEAKSKKAKNKGNKKLMPREQSFHWTGKITTGTINIKRTEDRNGYEEFTLTRESPKTKDEAIALKTKAKQRKKDEERRKELEKYNSKKIKF